MCESAHELAVVSVVISSVSEKLHGQHLALIEALQKFLLFPPAGRVSRATCNFLTPQLLVPPSCNYSPRATVRLCRDKILSFFF